MRLTRRLALTALALALPSVAIAAEGASPIQISLFSPIQIVKADRSVTGLRLNLLYGKNVDVTGIDWGLCNHNTGNGAAWQSGLVNIVEKDFKGFQEGAVNITRGSFTGLQYGWFNQSDSFHGMALGLVNVSKSARGVQLGLFNMTQTMHGLQIGVGNVIQKGKIPVLPIVNWSM